MDFQSHPPPPLPRLIYLDPPPPPDLLWSQQQDQVHHEEHASEAPRPRGSMAVRARLAKLPPPEAALKCPRCESTNTKFCYFNNYSLTQPRHFCKTCRRYWTRGGALRNVPVGGGCRRRSNNSSSKNTHKRKRGGSKSPIANSKPDYNNISISGDILENFLTQSTHPAHLPPPADPLSDHQYNPPADIYDPAVGFILGNRFHNISEQWMRGPAQFPYMDPNPVVASEIADDHHPLMKVELGSVGLNLLGSSTNDHDDHEYWAAGGNDNVMMMSNNSNNIASSAWTDQYPHLSRFVHMTSSSSTPTTHDLLM